MRMVLILGTRLILVVGGALVVSGCVPSTPSSTPGKVRVVAAEDFWGSIARQIGGDRADVESLVDNPAADPHDHEASPSDATAMAQAQVVVFNGLGYDQWAGDLLAANPSKARQVVEVGRAVGLSGGANPHRWYAPGDVSRVIAALTVALGKAAPADAAYFDSQSSILRTAGFKEYDEVRASIKANYAGMPIGATESIVQPLADDLGLVVLTPASFLEAVAEGRDPKADDKATADAQIVGKQIRVLIFNSQNTTPDVQSLVDECGKAGIGVIGVTETLSPKGVTFQAWQVAQLRALEAALAKATRH